MTEKYYKEGWTCEECERLRGIIEKQEQSFNARDANRAKANVNLAKRIEAEQKENGALKKELDCWMNGTLKKENETLRKSRRKLAKKLVWADCQKLNCDYYAYKGRTGTMYYYSHKDYNNDLIRYKKDKNKRVMCNNKAEALKSASMEWIKWSEE